jgi:ATP-dependent helicase HepA
MTPVPVQFQPGQRWVSESEPELGLGSVLSVNDRTVTIGFKASDATRQYARNNAPLRRVRFASGATVRSRKDTSFIVKAVSEREGLIFYHGEGRGGGRELCETELNDRITFNKAEERLFAGAVDPPEVFDLRVEALNHQYHRRKSRIRGFVGGRIDLIPHQLYIAAEVASRLSPRVLLADEVGLGKTIEACLILHRLILTGRVQRALILVPESLVPQWFVELLRRFNLWFHIFDEERCMEIEASNSGINPFMDAQFVLSTIGMFTTSARRLQQAIDASWDILVVDEAHHLGWTRSQVSPEYAAVESLGRKTPGMLLLTGTPEQLGIGGHFGRLRLLDPHRFYDLDEYIREVDEYKKVARAAEKLLEDPVRLAALLDQHGTGRVRFRNTRATIIGFPRRAARIHRLNAPAADAELLDALSEEFADDTDFIAASVASGGGDYDPPPCADLARDPRIDWLVGFLRFVAPDKVLLICCSEPKVAAIDAALRQRIRNLKMGVFHEGLTLIQRDRNAAWFAEENGARILVCSEIGSEGRNFQFAHHLVLFDLPLSPELLEQRIGRLDRIGQTSEIQVHVPFVAGSAQEVLVRWYHEGLNAFEANLQGGRELLERFGARIYELAVSFHETEPHMSSEMEELIKQTRTAREEIVERLHDGRDRLLELNSYRPEPAHRLVSEIEKADDDPALDEFMLSVFDHYAIQVEEIGFRTYRLGAAGAFVDSFPGLPAGGFTVTSDRDRALQREDIQFLTWDHPLVTGAIDLILASEKGNSSYARLPDSTRSSLILEVVYLLECIAPAVLHIDRFLPPTPVHVLVDSKGDKFETDLKPLKKAVWSAMAARDELLPQLIERSFEMANSKVAAIVAQARKEMTEQLDYEIERLQELQKVNRSVRPEEIKLLASQRREIDGYLGQSRLRLDAIRLIQRG